MDELFTFVGSKKAGVRRNYGGARHALHIG
jgi:hypothetical protein